MSGPLAASHDSLPFERAGMVKAKDSSSMAPPFWVMSDRDLHNLSGLRQAFRFGNV
jgi:hypothetical protein